MIAFKRELCGRQLLENIFIPLKILLPYAFRPLYNTRTVVNIDNKYAFFQPITKDKVKERKMPKQLLQ